MDARRMLVTTAFAASNVALYALLRSHYNDVCSSPNWFVSLVAEPSSYCTLLSRAISILKVAPLFAVGANVGPLIGAPLF
jgi:hypothetical protein